MVSIFAAHNTARSSYVLKKLAKAVELQDWICQCAAHRRDVS